MTESGSSARSSSFTIEGRRLVLPAQFRAGSSMTGIFVVPTTRMRSRLAGTGFVPAEIAPGRTLMGLNCVHYVDTDCGAYEEIAFSAFILRHDRPPGRVPYFATLRDLATAKIGSFAWRLAVTTTLSRDAGKQIWGFPKTVEDLVYAERDGSATMAWGDDSREVLRFTVPTRGRRTVREISPPVYSMLDGVAHVGRLTQSYGNVGYHRHGVQVAIGTGHPAAEELRSLGLPKRPVIAVSNGTLNFSMSRSTPLG
ncbi:hypothetical protein [Mycobacterium spongiae]|uniref:Acetoacetate decarboxylase n=1 Tax=Mycobacterium spongiae TaxID=886343 RepID=A0A975PX08_9MYCO|nr:hypothetical protein [Mycobacterium spongiae]QUR67720.1 hypothetical protein F6B93_11960 [Mycobacterium spongiae]